ncbi:helix-turn-helix domain-containing protein [Rhizobium leguminosarum]|uniref:helix-turn-helix domain-containing protein n=1 Tax=Rhizobium leguminosarum TaxID=384 RepID=UPI0021BBC357|nr:helix-turn-helix domain-containing protein [Rhizobium leguminosarum]
MDSQIVHFAGLSDRDRKAASPLPKLGAGDRLELHVRHEGGKEQTLSIPPSAAAAVEALLAHMLRGERVAVLAEEQELSPTEVAAILGISRPLVVIRMARGDLPFRYVGKHRRALNLRKTTPTVEGFINALQQNGLKRFATMLRQNINRLDR